MAEQEVGFQRDESNEENGMVGGMIEVGNYNAGVDNDVDKECVQGMPLTHHLLIPSQNRTHVTYHVHYAHIYVSLLGYLVPYHHLLIELTYFLHVHPEVVLKSPPVWEKKEELESQGSSGS